MTLLKNNKILYLLGGMASWAILSSLNIYEQVYMNFDDLQELLLGIHPQYIKAIFLNSFLLCTFLYIHQFHKGEYENKDFYGSLWKAFAMSLACGFSSMSLSFLIYLLKHNTETLHTILYSVFYQIDFGLLVVFLLTLFIKWKQLIVKSSTQLAQKVWRIFEYTLLLSLVFHFVHFEINLIFYISFGVVFLLGLGLSFNLGWVSHLNFRQKLMGLFILFIILVLQSYFFVEILDYANLGVLATYTVRSTFFIAIYAFTAVYSMVAMLGLLFNLPTSSVFEKKINELASFQELNRAILSGDNEKQVYQLLLDSALQTTKVQAAWLEIDKTQVEFITKNITQDEAQALNHLLKKLGYRAQRTKRFSARQVLGDHAENFPFHSFLCVPLIAKGKVLGTLVLLKELENAFDNVMIASLRTFVMQASLAIYNFRLIADAIANQRYRDELKIAHNVVDALLPNTLESNETFEIAVKTGSTDEVGGDYYDYYQVAPHKHVLIIADVAGKGTSAAFNMAQMKGIFQSLVRLDLSPDLFFEYANDALSSCLPPKSFITGSYVVIDTERNCFFHSRAGHCPTLYYSMQDKKTMIFNKGGLGLGIMRNKRYADHIQVERFDYQKGDVMMLYTDGIVEARHPTSLEEYGYDRLETFFSLHHDLPLHEMADLLIRDIHTFIESEDIGDDYTILLLRFV